VQPFQTESFDQGLLGESLLGEYIGRARRLFFSLRRGEEDELLDLCEFFEQWFDG
jgi:hypothetical protein